MAKAFNKIKTGLELDDRITFGKYTGAEVKSLIIIDPSYFQWIIDNCRDVYFAEEVFTFAEQRKPKSKQLYTFVPYTPQYIPYAGVHDDGQGREIISNNDWNDDIPF